MPYFPQSHPEFNGLRHLLLLYGDESRPWTAEDLKFSVAHVDREGRADDWLYDSFLFLNAKAPSGHDYCADINLGTTMCGEGDFFAMCSPRPGTRQDWEDLLEFYFRPGGALSALDEAIARASREIGRPYGAQRNAVLMLPYPHITQASWGRLGAAALDFGIDRQNLARATEQRLAACAWFVDEVARRIAETPFAHVRVLGVYWMFESVYRGWNVDDHWLLKSLRPRIHQHGLKFLWIPFWSAYNVHLLDDYQSYYFDLAFLQPNYMFYATGKSLHAAAAAARRRGAGIEMEYYLELDEPIGVTGERHARFRDYLNGGVTYGYMKDAACAHFQGVGALGRMHAHEDPREREFYEDIYHFVKGDYAPKPAIARPGDRPGPERAAIAVDLGGTHLRAAVVDESGRLLLRRALATPAGRDAILARIQELVSWARGEAAARGISVAGIGVSTGGRVDHLRGIVLDATSLLEGWRDVPLAATLTAVTGLPVRVDNDGHCATFAEQRFGAARGLSHFVTVIVGTGIGGGVVIEGALVRGARNAAGELGHLQVDADGPPCTCGGRGCVETFASGSGIVARARDAMLRGEWQPTVALPEVFGAEAVGVAAAQGDAVALSLVDQAGRALGVAVSGLVNVLNPERVILAGPVLRLGAPYLAAARAAIEQRTLGTARDSCEIEVSVLDEPALLGAAALVFESS